MPPRRRFLRSGLGLIGLGLLAGCGVPLPPAGQPPAMRRVGLLTQGPFAATAEERAFGRALRDLGWIEGENLAIENRWSRSKDGHAGAAAELVAAGAELIVAAGDEPGRAAKKASRTTPVVLAVSSDPVGSGLVTRLDRPGGQVTGLVTHGPELGARRLELLKQALPGASRVAVVWDPTLPDLASETRGVQAAGGALGIELQFARYRSRTELSRALEDARSWPADALMLLGDPLYPGFQGVPDEDLPGVRLSAMAGYAAFARAGGLMAYGPNAPSIFARAATYVDKLLNGTEPAGLPVERPTAFDFAINLRTAQTLGVTLSQEVLMRATEVIW